ncbi:MAG: cupin domain-containing protein [Clostridiales bacterium]|nr:cupin domain-containing protein [Clostridiales bacterium]
MIYKTLEMYDLIDKKKDAMITFFDKFNTPNKKVTFGYAVFAPGSRVPEEGFSRHEQDEYAYIIKGKAKIVIDGEVIESTANTASFIPAGEDHYSFNDSGEVCELIWMLVEK